MADGDKTYSAQANASGVAVVNIRTNSRNRTWTVKQVSVEMVGAPIGSACTLRKNGTLVTPMVPSGDSASGDPPVILKGGTDTLTVTWTGATPNAIGNVLVFYDDGV